MKVCPVCGDQYGDDAAFCARDRSPLTDTSGGDLIGQVIGDRYQVERKLGEGGMGQVYLARHALMGRRCAIKVMSPSMSRDPDAISRFNREATNASRISHPNVCAVYDFGLTSEGRLFLAMEYLEGKTLTDLLAEGPLPIDRAVAILRQCADGLTAAHDLGIVHRDLKPDNIMLLDQRGKETVKLVDFGIAKAVTGEEGQKVTQTGLIVGTPAYMSPEQLSSDVLDARSDEYSLALVLYRMITGGSPFEATSAQETMVKRLTERPKPLAEVAPALRFPPALQAVLDRALERKAADRYPSVEVFAEAAAAALAPNVGTRDLPRTKVVRPTPTWRPAVLIGGGMVLLAAGWGAWRFWSGPAPTPPPPPPPPPVAVQVDSTNVATTPPPSTPPTRDSQHTTVKPALDRLPVAEDFDRKNSPEAEQAFDKALSAFNDEALGDSVRAEMGTLVAIYRLEKRRPGAGPAVRRACRLFNLARCKNLLEQYKDVP